MNMRDLTWLKRCFYTAALMYGMYPYEVLEALYAQGEDDKLNKDEVLDFVEQAPYVDVEYYDTEFGVFKELGYGPGFFRPVVTEDKEQYRKYKVNADKGNVYAKLHISEKEIEALLQDQSNVPFYIPTKAEITEISDRGFIENKYFKDIRKNMRKGINEDGFLERIWTDFNSSEDVGVMVERVSSIVETKKTMDLDELNRIARLTFEAYNHTNQITSRGWEPAKLQETLGERGVPDTIVPMSNMAAENMKGTEGFFNQMGIKVDYESGFGKMAQVDENGAVHRIKIGRNDPCPCGSGKKYKKCHGRNDKSAETQRINWIETDMKQYGEPVEEAEKEVTEEPEKYQVVGFYHEGTELAKDMMKEFPSEKRYFYINPNEKEVFLTKEPVAGGQTVDVYKADINPMLEGFFVFNTVLCESLANFCGLDRRKAVSGYAVEQEGIIVVDLNEAKSMPEES